MGLTYSKLFKRKRKGRNPSLVAEELTLKIYEGDGYEVLMYNSARVYQGSSPELQKQ